MNTAKFQQVIPVLAVRNVSDAIAYYTTKLGFELKYADRPQDPCAALMGKLASVCAMPFGFPVVPEV